MGSINGGSLQPEDVTLMTFQKFFKARREKKIAIKITPVDTKFKIRILKVSSSYGFVQVMWHILGNGHRYPKHSEPFG